MESSPRFSALSYLTGSERARANDVHIQEDVVALYDRFRLPLFRYLRSIGLRDTDCEEVIQETFLALFRHFIAGKPRHNLQSWLFAVSRNLAFKQSRRQAGEVDLTWAVDASDQSRNPEEALEHAQRTARIAAVIQALPAPDRECLVLRSEGLRYRDIAGMQKRSLGAVVLAVKRSLTKLAEVSGR